MDPNALPSHHDALPEVSPADVHHQYMLIFLKCFTNPETPGRGHESPMAGDGSFEERVSAAARALGLSGFGFAVSGFGVLGFPDLEFWVFGVLDLGFWFWSFGL